MTTYSSADTVLLRGAWATGLSADDFFVFCTANKHLRLERLATGEILLRPPLGFQLSQLAAEVAGQLSNWNRRARRGTAVGSLAAYLLPDGATLSPTASWVSRNILEKIPPASRRQFLSACPEFVTELIASAEHLTDAQAKMAQWLANGTQLGFLLTDQPETAYVYRPGQPVEVLVGFDRELSGEAVLPGFKLDLQELREL